MNWIDYREKLGIGFNDNEKFHKIRNYILNYLNLGYKNENIDRVYVDFCLMVGELIENKHGHQSYFICVFDSANDLKALISYYIAFVNSQDNKSLKSETLKVLTNACEKFNIQYEIIKDDDGYFIFPKGAEELDKALISDPLLWLSDYPNAHKTFINALKQYSDGIYIRDVADNLRKSLEEFLKEFLGNEKNLDNNKIEVAKFLSNNYCDKNISSMFVSLLSSYNTLNNEIAKHNDKVDKKILEFLLYQTGLFIRMLIVVKKSEQPSNTQ